MREEQSDETDEFLELFENNVSYIEGGEFCYVNGNNFRDLIEFGRICENKFLRKLGN